MKNPYNKISTFLHRVLPRPQPAPEPTPVPEKRVNIQPTPVPEQRFPYPQPTITEDPAIELRVTVIPMPPVIQSLVQSPRVVPPKPLPSYSPLGLGLPPAHRPILTLPSPERPEKRSSTRKLSNHSDLPRLTEGALHCYNTSFRWTVHHIVQNVSMERYYITYPALPHLPRK